MPRRLGRVASAALGLDRTWGWDGYWEWDWDWARDWGWDRAWDRAWGWGWGRDPYWVRLPEERRDA